MLLVPIGAQLLIQTQMKWLNEGHVAAATELSDSYTSVLSSTGEKDSIRMIPALERFFEQTYNNCKGEKTLLTIAAKL